MSLGVGAVKLPTSRDDWRLTARTARLVLTIPTYAVVALLTGIVALSVFVLTQNLALVGDVVLNGTIPLANRLRVLFGQYPFLGGAFTPTTAVAIVAIAALVGVDIAMVVYHFREHGVSPRESSGSAVGVLLGTLGAGCAACGSVLLAGLFSLVGASGLLLLLPFDGLEFTFLALFPLVLSMYWIADGMRGGEINGCPVDVARR
ncbi:hypothetical protein SAMN04487949_1748 [Halogranum gelatinilyticum]|uniref:Uncharacterized protein n=1 Tax=Halogranum gelatinilyticum TaxID=660521 RepID=A0A1G9TF05_9EURY|nr:hypothetical protein [Halogranum gelatinilyticum]SDM46306.1 hypothetical protein SAMN04487949_1748 [Halogranum gelatinilyticum]